MGKEKSIKKISSTSLKRVSQQISLVEKILSEKQERIVSVKITPEIILEIEHKFCPYCGQPHKIPGTLFCSHTCGIDYEQLTKEFKRCFGSEVRNKERMLHYMKVFREMGRSDNCTKWIPQYNGWYNLWDRKDCKVRGGFEQGKYCVDCIYRGDQSSATKL
jgi:predicted nucleic acid-binding Zn ribbon protein